MIRKDLVPQLTEIQKKKLTTKNLANALMLIMKTHIGQEMAIHRDELYLTLFEEADRKDLKSDLRWLYVKNAFNYLRRKTKCFCSSLQYEGGWYYFVIEDDQDRLIYNGILDKNIKAMKKMKLKAKKAIKEKWHKTTWHLPNEKPLKELIGE